LIKKKFLDGMAAILGASCLFGLPVLTVGFIGWGGDELVSYIPVKPEEIHTFYYQALVVGVMLFSSVAALVVSAILFGGIWLLAMRVQQSADAIEEPLDLTYRPVESKRVRVGMMVRKGGPQALSRIEKELARKNLKIKSD
jgi:hypothetical protein